MLETLYDFGQLGFVGFGILIVVTTSVMARRLVKAGVIGDGAFVGLSFMLLMVQTRKRELSATELNLVTAARRLFWSCVTGVVLSLILIVMTG